MEKDIASAVSEEDPHSPEKSTPKEKTMKYKKAEQELRKCLGTGRKKLEESVLKTYFCAWQKDILIHGRLHLTQNSICFYSNILGWETKTIVYLKDVTAISKQKTALVFPNAILIEAADKKYGFTSFVHRDRVYKVLQLIWHNWKLHEPSTAEFLKSQLHEGRKHRKSPSEWRSKSPTFGADIETISSSPTHFDSLSLPSTPHTSDDTLHPKLQLVQILSGSESDVCIDGTTESDCGAGAESEEIFQQVNGERLYRGRPTLSLRHSSSTSSSDAGTCSDGSSVENSPSQGTVSEHSHVNSSSLESSGTDSQTLDRSPSLLTLKPSMSELEVEAIRGQPQALLGGSPNFLHHWKTTLSLTLSFNNLWQSLVTSTKPQHLLHICTPTKFINVLIILFIVLLLLSTVSMVCQLSQVEPAFQPYLSWQPWCSCLQATKIT